MKGWDAFGLMFSDKFRPPKYLNNFLSPNRTSLMQPLDQGVIRRSRFIICAKFLRLYWID
jgi:hypothetical protein